MSTTVPAESESLRGFSILIVEDDYFVAKEMAAVLRDHGAQVLGPIRVGHGARIGANAVVVVPVVAGCTVVGIPARPPKGKPCEDAGIGYGLLDVTEDPVGEQLAALRAEIAALRAELEQVKAQERV